MASPSPIDTLLRLVSDHPERVLAHLSASPANAALATAADENGYTLIHAAASYTQLDLLRTLVQTYHVDINTTDTEGETALFYAETLAAATCLVEELGADDRLTNSEDVSAAENAQTNHEDGDGGEWGIVAAYLAARGTKSTEPSTGATAHGAAAEGSDGEELHAPPPLPPGVKINMGTVQEAGDEGEPDPEFRRRIEELAARDDFQTEQGQAELRKLVTEAIGGMAVGGSGGEAKSRRTD